MKIYNFYDTDPTGWEEYDISGEDYKELMRTCCKYSKTMSFIILDPDVVSYLNELEKFNVEKDDNIIDEKVRYGRPGQKIQPYRKYYRVCPELCELLISMTDSIFKLLLGWGQTNPDDPTFYRADGSVFFSSIIHEGEITLYPRDDEDVSNIVSKPHWIEKEVYFFIGDYAYAILNIFISI